MATENNKAIITVDSVEQKEGKKGAFIKLKDKSQKTFNADIILGGVLVSGWHGAILYDEFDPAPGYSHGSKWIRKTAATDKPDTWEAKQPYQGGGSSGGGGRSNDPDTNERIAKQVTAKCACEVYGATHDKLDLDQFKMEYPAVYDIIWEKLNESPKSSVGSDAGAGLSPSGSEFDNEFDAHMAGAPDDEFSGVF
jgi:hypothetical protein